MAYNKKTILTGTEKINLFEEGLHTTVSDLVTAGDTNLATDDLTQDAQARTYNGSGENLTWGNINNLVTTSLVNTTNTVGGDLTNNVTGDIIETGATKTLTTTGTTALVGSSVTFANTAGDINVSVGETNIIDAVLNTGHYMLTSLNKLGAHLQYTIAVTDPSYDTEYLLEAYKSTTTGDNRLTIGAGLDAGDTTRLKIVGAGIGKLVQFTDAFNDIQGTPYTLPLTAPTVGQTLIADANGDLLFAASGASASVYLAANQDTQIIQATGVDIDFSAADRFLSSVGATTTSWVVPTTGVYRVTLQAIDNGTLVETYHLKNNAVDIISIGATSDKEMRSELFSFTAADTITLQTTGPGTSTTAYKLNINKI